IDAIFSAAEIGFTGSLVGSMVLTKLAAYMGTITVEKQMSQEQRRVLLQWEPPHWCRKPKALWISRNCCHMSCGHLSACKGSTSSPACRMGASGKLAWKSRSSRLASNV
uniref:Uncharacterized protein n=1 Tax=Scleropages formosus TaxID=113540 RepID=A0A8C9QZP1_SCLFO